MSVVAELGSRISGLEQQVKRLTRELQDLKGTRNSFNPLVRLPDELLLVIAELMVPMPTELSVRSHFLFTWICRRQAPCLSIGLSSGTTSR